MKKIKKENVVASENQSTSEMALPPINKDESNNKKKGKNHLFSKALFKESLHSNRLGLTIVSLGNALIMVIIITILSMLHINATSAALADLFSNADYENTVKSGAISLYSSYENTASAYELFIDSDESVKNLFETEVSKVEDTTLNSAIEAAKTLYDTTYKATPGDAITKQTVAKSATMELANKTIDTLPSYSDEEKDVAKKIISYYFDIYAQDTSKDTKTILKQAIPEAFSDTIIATYKIDNDEKKEHISYLFTNAIDRVYTNNEKISEVKIDSSLSLIPTIADNSISSFIKDMCTGLLDKYNNDKDAYIKDDSIRTNYVSSSCQKYVVQVLEENAYYQYLPDFTVEYKTNDLGYPVRLVGTGKYAENGTEIKVEVPVTIYNPDVYIKESEKMGKTSNMLQKMRKEIITGSPYTTEEINTAKEKSKNDLELITSKLNIFMKEYIKRTDNKNTYYTGSEIDEDAIIQRAVNEVSQMAEETLISSYNEKNELKISTIEEITIENSSMSGKEMMTLVKGYAASGISSFKTYYSGFIDDGYTSEEAILLATNKGSQGVMAQLPTSVDDSLKEMGEMNTYGIIVGVVAFGIAALLIPFVYTILLSKSLISEKVETGSLAFTLSTPTTRESFIFTQGCYLVFSEIVMAISLLVFSIITREIGILAGSTDLTSSLPIKDLCLYALGNFMVAMAISGINFLTSCHYNKTSQSIGVGGGIAIFFFICSILGLFATEAIPGTIRISMMSIFNYMTIDSLFDALAVMKGNYSLYFIKLSVLLAITIVTYIIGALDFRKKDLPL